MSVDDTASLENELSNRVMELVAECRRLNYNPSLFVSMIAELGALGAVQRLLQPPAEKCSDGFTRLWELKRLDLAVESIAAFEERFGPLFTLEERQIARQRLALYGKLGP